MSGTTSTGAPVLGSPIRENAMDLVVRSNAAPARAIPQNSSQRPKGTGADFGLADISVPAMRFAAGAVGAASAPPPSAGSGRPRLPALELPGALDAVLR